MSVDPQNAFGPFSSWHRPLDAHHPARDNAAFSTQSYTYSSRLGEDGNPIIRESRHAVTGQGKFRQEEYELRDGDRREHGTARAIGDRSVVQRSIMRSQDAPEESETNFNNMGERDAAAFDAEWNSSSMRDSAACLLEPRRDRSEPIAIKDRSSQQSSRQ